MQRNLLFDEEFFHAHIVHESEQPEIVAKLEVASYRARIERAVIIKIYPAQSGTELMHNKSRLEFNLNTNINTSLRPDINALTQTGNVALISQVFSAGTQTKVFAEFIHHV